jgi:hypothetical protein
MRFPEIAVNGYLCAYGGLPNQQNKPRVGDEKQCCLPMALFFNTNEGVEGVRHAQVG